MQRCSRNQKYFCRESERVCRSGNRSRGLGAEQIADPINLDL